jgi:hypothetical protein
MEEPEKAEHETAAVATQERAPTPAAEEAAHRPKPFESRKARKNEPPQVLAATEDRARHDSVEALPLHMWVKAATQPDDAGAAADWTRELLRKPSKAETDG